MRRHAAFAIAIILITLGAAAFRLPRLGQRPMHGDEANQAFKAGRLLEEGYYRYDPVEHHGPTLYYATLPAAWLTGASTLAEMDEFTCRIVPVVFGTALVLLLLVVGDGFGRPAAVCAGVLTAISPAMVFYSRYYIQEMLLVFFAFAAIAFGWRYVWSKRPTWAVLAAVSLALMHATKETCVLAFGAMALALVAKVGWRRWWGYPIRVRAVLNPRHVVLAAAVGLAVSVVFFSSFFTHWRGPLDSVLCYVNYAERSGGAGLHDNPWHYYLKMLAYTQETRGPWWSEGVILFLALVGFVSVILPTDAAEARTPLVRFVAFYTLFLTAAYALVPYKTPWCMLGFLHGMILLAGVGAVVLVHLIPTRPLKTLLTLGLVLGAFHLGVQAHRTNYKFYVDRRNPYVYAHTGSDLLNLVQRVNEIAAVSPDGYDTVIKVYAPDADYWPLPWYLRKFPNVGYWLEPPADPDAPMVIASAGLDEQLTEALKGDYFAERHGLRPQVHMLLYIRRDLWDAFIESRAKLTPPP